MKWDWFPAFGIFCHWCGARVPDAKLRRIRTGKHPFCMAACKVAHHRAFTAYHKRDVTPRPAAAPSLVRRSIAKSNEIEVGRMGTSSPAIASMPGRKSNNRKGSKYTQ